MRQTEKISWRYFDYWLLGAVALLVIIGITMIRSAVAGNIELVQLNLVRRQLIFALIGFVVILSFSKLGHKNLFWSTIYRSC